MDNHNSHKYKLSIAPMLGITTHHFRSFFRLLSKEILLYTEMINCEAIINSKQTKLINYFPEHRPLVLQIGGSNPSTILKACEKVKELSYTEFNLNCGCPSKKVSDRAFGASLMNNPPLVSECIKEMNKVNYSSIKCRIGLNEFNKKFLDDFIKNTSINGGCKKYIIHSRIAIMGIDTIKNRKIPPLQTEIVYKLKDEYPNLLFTLNGGIKTLEEVKYHNEKGLSCMIGRAAYENPWIFRKADKLIFGKSNCTLSRKEVIYKYADYCDKFEEEYCEEINNNVVNDFIRPLTNLFYGEPFNKEYRDLLYDIKKETKNDYHLFREHLYNVVEEFEKINANSMNEI